MPLTPGSGEDVISNNISEFHGGPTYQATEAKFGKDKANKQAVAVAMSEARKTGGKKVGMKKKPAKKIGMKKKGDEAEKVDNSKEEMLE